MSSVTRIVTAGAAPAHPVDEAQKEYIQLVLEVMAAKDLGLRKLANKTGIGKSRLGLVLHSDPGKRVNISLLEFQIILRALDIDSIEAVISVEACRDRALLRDERFATLIAMLSEVFKGLPMMLVTALEEIEGIDGTEVRREWAGPLQKAVVEKLVKEVSAIMTRRVKLTEVSSLGL